MKRVISLLFCAILLFSSLSYAESATNELQELYAEAELLMAKGSYSDAATKFDTLGAYSDASQMAMYCKAIAAAETLGMYSIAVETFQKLGDFKDSEQMAYYYVARGYEASADSVTVDTEDDSLITTAIDYYKDAEKYYGDLALFKDCMSRYASCLEKRVSLENELENRQSDSVESAYLSAVKLQEDKDYENAIKAFKALADYKDSNNRVLECNYQLAQEYEASCDWGKAMLYYAQAGEYEDSKDRYAICNAGQKEDLYQTAYTLEQDGKYMDAISSYDIIDLIGYKDTKKRINACYDAIYAIADEMEKSGEYYNAALTFYSIKNYSNSWERCFDAWGMITKRNTIASDMRYNFHISEEGTCTYHKDTYEDIAAIEYYDCLIMLRNDGTVLKTSYFDDSDFRDIVAIAALDDIFAGLKADGTVIRSRFGIDCQDWKDIIMICASKDTLAGLTKDGTVVVTGKVDKNQDDVSDWTDIIDIAANNSHIFGLKSDGTVLMTDYGKDKTVYACADWHDIVSISAKDDAILGVHKDGTVEMTGKINTPIEISGKPDVLDTAKLSDIVYACMGCYNIIGLKSDGTPVMTGYTVDDDEKADKWSTVLMPPKYVSYAKAVSVYSDKETIKAVQQALNDKGFDCGTPDGAAGKKTKAAILDYQKANGLNETGTATYELLVNLGLIQ